ncbi:YM-216391 family RiPP peptide [Streptomyces curacoi]|nr:YM-216391 family RiPP peptide [Streptomyces curacoi]
MFENTTAEIEEVDIEVGFIIGSTCCSLEMEEDDLDVAAEETEAV